MFVLTVYHRSAGCVWLPPYVSIRFGGDVYVR